MADVYSAVFKFYGNSIPTEVEFRYIQDRFQIRKFDYISKRLSVITDNGDKGHARFFGRIEFHPCTRQVDCPDKWVNNTSYTLTCPFPFQVDRYQDRRKRRLHDRHVRGEAELADIASSEFDKQLKALTSIKGIGITLATALILTTGGFTYFDNAKQLSRFIGICPTYQQSGTSVNIKGHINRNGDEHLRSLLYVASWTALRYNAACRECYIRLKANGKPSKVALIAVANKLVRQAFAIVTTDSTYIDGLVSTKK